MNRSGAERDWGIRQPRCSADGSLVCCGEIPSPDREPADHCGCWQRHSSTRAGEVACNTECERRLPGTTLGVQDDHSLQSLGTREVNQRHSSSADGCSQNIMLAIRLLPPVLIESTNCESHLGGFRGLENVVGGRPKLCNTLKKLLCGESLGTPLTS